MLVEEFNGDGDHIIGADEEIRISWNLSDFSDIGSTQLLVDGAPVARDGDYYAVLGPLDPNTHSFTISATDADVTPESAPLFEGQFTVVQVEEITVLDAGTPLTDGQIVPVPIGNAAQGAPGPSKVFFIRNDGGQALNITSVAVSDAVHFSWTTAALTVLSSGASTHFTVTLLTGIADEFPGTVTILNSDGPYSPDGLDEHEFTFPITGIVTAPSALIVDDGDPGYSETGTWGTGSNVGGYDGDYRYHLKTGPPASEATWTFPGLAPGSYEVYATWGSHTNRSASAPFTILDGAVSEGTVAVNQKVAPNDVQDDGQWWERLAQYDIDSGDLTVRLSHAADGIVIADAIRIVRVADATAPTAAVQTNFAPVAGTTTTSGVIRYEDNVAVDVSTLDGWDVRVTGPNGFDQFISYDGVVPGGNGTPRDATYHITAPGGTWGSEDNGTYHVYIEANQVRDTSANAVVAAEIGTFDYAAVTVSVLDDGAPGYVETGTWATGANAGGYQGDYRYHRPETGAGTAAWTFSGLAAGSYEVYASWVPHTNRSASAPFTILDGAAAEGTVAVNQKVGPNDVQDGGQWWERLGQYSIASGSLTVRLSHAADGIVIADAIRVVSVAPGGNPEGVADALLQAQSGSLAPASGVTQAPLRRSAKVLDPRGSVLRDRPRGRALGPGSPAASERGALLSASVEGIGYGIGWEDFLSGLSAAPEHRFALADSWWSANGIKEGSHLFRMQGSLVAAAVAPGEDLLSDVPLPAGGGD